MRHQKSRQFGFVTMASEAEGKLAIRRVNGQGLEGNVLTVKKAREIIHGYV